MPWPRKYRLWIISAAIGAAVWLTLVIASRALL